MAKKYVDLETLKFLLYQVHDLESVLQLDRYADHDQEAVDILLNAVKDFSDKELYPYFMEMDEKPAYFKDGVVHVHPQVDVMMKKGGEMGLIGEIFDYEMGGLQLPNIVHTASTFIQDAANNHLPGYTGLTLGAAELIIHFANEELKQTYVPKMVAGDWGGTMCLTEPQAGSSLSDITTTAYPAEDGSYRIKGQKIFISGGDHQYAENVVHLLLARIEGAPAGTKGISLFVVPKNRLTQEGTLEGNDVITAGDFQKMGQKGYCTTHLMFGEQNDCQGWLVGQPHQGLRYMFLMMNGARIGVGRGAAAIATAAYQASLEYAHERPQGRRLNNKGAKDLQKEQTLIVNHPDVRRMLLLQKVVSEASLSLVLLASRYQDFALNHADEAVRAKYHTLLELIIPVVKTYPSEMGATAVSNGLQVLGGYGFCTEYVLQQYHRDIRIFSIYEGTTGIQSLDLLGRKVLMQGGKAMGLLVEEMTNSIKAASTHHELQPYAQKLGANMQRIKEVLDFLTNFAKDGDHERFISDATIFMDLFSKVLVGWLWLDMATQAKQALVVGDQTYSADFYESKIHALRFYFKYEMTQTTSLAEILMDEAVLTTTTEKKVFA
ncbi:MAG: acyl-CoA dehydrogenase [Bacteroidota bacterium]